MQHKQLPEEYTIHKDKNSEMQVWNYLYGSCHLFALALSEATGWKIGAIFNDLRDEVGNENEFYLEHAFCYHPEDNDLVIDCRGVVDKDLIWQEYAGMSLCPVEIKDAKEILIERIKSGEYNDWESDLLPTLPEPSFIKNEKEIIENFIQEKIKEGVFPSFDKPVPRRRLKM